MDVKPLQCNATVENLKEEEGWVQESNDWLSVRIFGVRCRQRRLTSGSLSKHCFGSRLTAPSGPVFLQLHLLKLSGIRSETFSCVLVCADM